jgi:RNA-directed DNA polymerase
LKLEKTRLTHTFDPELSEDGKAGFDFLGHHIQQYPAGKYHCANGGQGMNLGFITLITPTKKASKIHQEKIKSIITKHRSSPQLALISELNPVIRGWANYYLSVRSFFGAKSNLFVLLFIMLLRKFAIT